MRINIHIVERIFAAILIFVILSFGAFQLWRYVDEASLSFVLLVTFVVSAFLISIIVYLMLSTQDRADRLVGRRVEGLIESRELFEELFRNSPVPYLLIDHRGVITIPNVAAIRLFDTAEGHLENKNIFNMLEGDDVEHVSLYPEMLGRGIYINDEEIRIVREDESTRWVLFSAFPFGGSGRSQQALLTLVDITKQKEIDRAKSEFVSLASHQLRTPISSMKWNAELLMGKHAETLDEAQRKYVSKIVRGVGRMDTLISDFLNVSQLELGTLSSKPVSITIEDLFSEIIDEQVERIETKGLEIRKNYDASVPAVLADMRLLRMSLGNLVSNAVKYTPENGRITLSTYRTPEGIAFSVSDTGLGIPKDDQDKLFSKLFRASNVRESIPDGTGLGLYIVELAVKTLGGTIGFESVEGEGTTFTIILPE